MNKIENIDNLISKFLSGNALPEDAMLLEDWKNENPTNKLYFLDCENIFKNNKNQSNIENIDNTKAWVKITQSINKETDVKQLQTKKIVYLRIAASFAFIISIGAIIAYMLNKNTSQELSYVTTNKPLFVNLNDSTKIHILENSKIVVDQNFGVKNRIVYLKGNADFNVTHKDELPFIVDAGSFFIKDIGTKFSVRLSLDTDTIYVNVDEGVVLLFDSLGSELEIKASEKAIYIRSKKQLINAQEINLNNAILKFENTTLKEVVLKLNSTYKTNIILQNTQLNNCTITTELTNEDIDTIITIIAETLGLDFEKTNSGYLIKGKACLP